ncbi:hypothetical protein PSI21_21200 [Xenorhabdus griffiniae]|nr:hypothetical protein [Xenorhabdus griffiniae]
MISVIDSDVKSGENFTTGYRISMNAFFHPITVDAGQLTLSPP